MEVKIMLVGNGAFAKKHLNGLQKIAAANVVSLVGRREDSTKALAEQYHIPHYSTNLTEALQQTEAEAVIITSPTQVHAEQAIQCMQAGKHVEIEIPVADSLADAQRIADTQTQTGLVCMGGHTRRFNPSHQWIKQRIDKGELHIQQLDVQTYFFRRTNTNAEGNPRSWIDHLLWHHACHTVDLFQYMTGETPTTVQALEGPKHPELGIAMDMSIGLKTTTGALCTLSLSFNNQGPLGTFFRYICDNGTYLARYNDLFDGHEKPIDVSTIDVSLDGIELQDREFIQAVQNGTEPNASIHQCLAAMQTLHRLEQALQ